MPIINAWCNYFAILSALNALDVLLLPEGLGLEGPDGGQVAGQGDLHLLCRCSQQAPATLAGVHQHHDALTRRRSPVAKMETQVIPNNQDICICLDLQCDGQQIAEDAVEILASFLFSAGHETRLWIERVVELLALEGRRRRCSGRAQSSWRRIDWHDNQRLTRPVPTSRKVRHAPFQLGFNVASRRHLSCNLLNRSNSRFLLRRAIKGREPDFEIYIGANCYIPTGNDGSSRCGANWTTHPIRILLIIILLIPTGGRMNDEAAAAAVGQVKKKMGGSETAAAADRTWQHKKNTRGPATGWPL